MGHRKTSRSAVCLKRNVEFHSAGSEHLLRNCCTAAELVLVSKPVLKEEKRELRTQADAEQHECESSVSAYSAVSSYKEGTSTWGNSPLCPSKHFI